MHKAYNFHAEAKIIVLQEREGPSVERHLFDVAGALHLRAELDAAIEAAKAAK